MTWPTDPPSADTVEVSVFGKGVGECIVVHVGGGDWFVVDSFIEPQTGIPIALSYLQGLGVKVGGAVKRVIATHWHADHTGGIAAVLEQATSSRMVFSQALRSSEFQALVSVDSKAGATASLSDLRGALEVLLQRGQKPMWAVENKLLWSSDDGDVHALSPSDHAITDFLTEIGSLLPTVGAPKRRLPSTLPNDTCVVLSVRRKDHVVLLGADLEKGTCSTKGWKAIVNAEVRPYKRLAGLFKVAHHGSVGAHEDGIWSTLLARDPVAVVTPYRALANPLPRSADVARIAKLATRLYCAGSRTGVKAPDRPPVVDKLLGKRIRVIDGRVGQVRVRFPLAGDVEIRPFGAAEKLNA